MLPVKGFEVQERRDKSMMDNDTHDRLRQTEAEANPRRFL
jgi:hypothetical protein